MTAFAWLNPCDPERALTSSCCMLAALAAIVKDPKSRLLR